jgi:hypothetical protein
MIETALPEQGVAGRAKVLALVSEKALQAFVPAVHASAIRLGISRDPGLEVGVVLWLNASVAVWLVETEICYNLVTQTPIDHVSICLTQRLAKTASLTLHMDGPSSY